MSAGKIAYISISPGAVSSAGSAAAAHAATHALAAGLAAAAPALLAVGGAAAAIVLTRAAMGGMAEMADRLEAGAANWKKEQQAADAWEEAVLAVAARQARIAAVRGALRKARGRGHGGPGVDLPDPPGPAGWARPLHLPRLAEWCAATDQQLAKAETALADQTAATALLRLSQLPGATGLVPVAATLADRHAVLVPALHPLDAHGKAAAGAGAADGKAAADGASAAVLGVGADRARRAGSGVTPDGGPAHTSAAIDRILSRLPRDIDGDDYAKVLEAAAKASDARSARVAKVWLDEMRLRAQTATRHAARRRDDAQTAARYLSALRLEEIDGTTFPPAAVAPYAHTRRRLEDVVAGDAELSPDLRAAAEDAVLHAQQIADRCFVTAQLQLALQGLGYTVDAGQQAEAQAVGTLGVSYPGWGDSSVRIDVLDGGEVRAAVQPGRAGINHRQVDAWRHGFADVQRALADAGVPAKLADSHVAPVDDQSHEPRHSTIQPRHRELPR